MVEINQLNLEELSKTLQRYKHSESLIGKTEDELWGKDTKALLECARAVLSYYGRE